MNRCLGRGRGRPSTLHASRWAKVAVLVMVVLLSGCGSPPPTPPPPTPATALPQFRVDPGGAAMVLPAWTYCLPGVCADGTPPAKPRSVGSPEVVWVSINQPGWQLTATFDDLPAPCRHLYEASVTRIHDQQWLLEPAGPAGLYDVHLYAAGPAGENAVATFRWATVNDGARPFPRKTCT